MAFRNPLTPKEEETFTPQQFLKRYLDFSTWYAQNPVNHESTCEDQDHNEVASEGMCCIEYLQYFIEFRFIQLAGIRTGIFVEPKSEGYHLWLELAEVRLAELQKGKDRSTEWTQLLKKCGSTLSDWIVDRSDMYAYNRRPGFSLKKYVQACKEYGFSPSLKEIAFAFGFSEEKVADYWTCPTDE